MKILYSCLSRSWGGMEMFTLTAVKQLLKRNIYVELLCVAESRIHIEANNMGLIIHPLNVSGYIHPLSTIKLANLIRKNKYSLIHTQASKDLWILVPSLKLAGSFAPLILTKQIGSFIIKKDALHRWLYNRINAALAISNIIKRNLIETVPLPEDKILLLHNGIDIVRFDPLKVSKDEVRKELGLNENEITIGMLARFSPGKGHEEFLYAARELNKSHSNLKFLVVGEASRGESEYAESIKQLAKVCGLNNVIFTGFRSDTERVLAAIDIFVFPSHSEAFGIALTEAMAMERPSVCAAADGVLDIAIDNKTSFLFEPQNSNDLKEKIELLINSPDTREKFGKAARQRVIENFDLEKLTEKVIEIYRRAITG